MKNPPLSDIPAALLDLVACFALAIFDTLFAGKSAERQMEELGQ